MEQLDFLSRLFRSQEWPEADRRSWGESLVINYRLPAVSKAQDQGINDPVALGLVEVIHEHFRYAGQGIKSGMARDLVGLSPEQISRIAVYKRLDALRQAGIIELHGKRWRPALAA